MIYSFSRLKKYEECNGSFYEKYILGREESVAEQMVLGKAVHGAIESIIQGENLLTAVLNSTLKEQKESKLRLDIAEVLRLVEAAKAERYKGETEKHIVLSLDPTDPFSPQIQMYIDLITEDGMVIDWKTNWVPQADKMQLKLYAWGYSQITGKKSVDVGFRYLRFNPSGRGWHVETLDQEDMEEARKWAYDLAVEIETKLLALSLGEGTAEELFPYTPKEEHCKICSFAATCAAAQINNPVEKSEDSPLKNEEEAIELAKKIIQLESALKLMKDDLKTWVTEKGEIKVGKSAFGFKPSVSWSFKEEHLKKISADLIERGIDPYSVLSLGATDLKALQKKMNLTDKDFESYLLNMGGKKKETKRFTNYVVEEQKQEDKLFSEHVADKSKEPELAEKTKIASRRKIAI